jgi:hypothetical protein
MKVVCAWCQKDLGEKEPLISSAVSHGMCPDCEKKINAPLDAEENFKLALKDAETCSLDELEAASDILKKL